MLRCCVGACRLSGMMCLSVEFASIKVVRDDPFHPRMDAGADIHQSCSCAFCSLRQVLLMCICVFPLFKGQPLFELSKTNAHLAEPTDSTDPSERVFDIPRM